MLQKKTNTVLLLLLSLLCLMVGCGAGAPSASVEDIASVDLDADQFTVGSDQESEQAETDSAQDMSQLSDSVADKDTMIAVAEEPGTNDNVTEFTVQDSAVYVNGEEATEDVIALNLSHCDVQGDYSFLSKYAWIKKLIINDDALIDLSFLENMSQLTDLQLTCSATDFSPIRTLPLIEDLTLTGTSGLTSLDFLDGMALKSLSLDFDDCLLDISALDGMESLESLSMVFCPLVTDFSALSSLTGLHLLNVSFTSFDDLTLLSKLSWLEDLSVADCSVDSRAFADASYQLNYLYITDLDQESLELLKNQFPNCEIQN